MIRTEAPGKVILIGEYAVLFGASALVASVGRCARVSFEPAQSFSLSALGLTVNARTSQELRERDQRLALVASVLDEVDEALPSARISIDTTDFYDGGVKLGFGSSAAVAVALADALRRARGERPTSELLFRDAHRAHRRAQGGVGSGIDIAASAYGGVLAYQAPRGEESVPRRVRTLPWPEKLRWAVVFTGRSASTPQLIGAVNALQARAPERATSLIDTLSEQSEAGVRAFESGDPQAFLRCVESFREALSALGKAAHIAIVSDSHRQKEAVACRSGAVYKPSGAGGGDIGVAFWADAGAAPFRDALPLELYPAMERDR